LPLTLASHPCVFLRRFQILVTQVFLSVTEAFSFVALWSGAVRGTNTNGTGDSSKHNSNLRVRQLSVVFKLWHVLFFIFEVTKAIPAHGVFVTLLGDNLRNPLFLAEDLLYLLLFFDHTELRSQVTNLRLWAGVVTLHLTYLWVNSVLDLKTT
jgi:hypothetical protein